MADSASWQPSATIDTLVARARMIQTIRQFFSERDVLEVETPILSQYSGTDLQLSQWHTEQGHSLHTSPEFAMKRLLAAGSGDIFQICHAFRRDELGQRHNPEFTMLEWYRVGMDEFGLMDDVVNLISFCSGQRSLERQCMTYEEAFLTTDLPDPHRATLTELRQTVADKLHADATTWTRDDCLDALMSMVVEPSLPRESLCFIHQYPKSQAALAQHQDLGDIQVARRFELYWQGMELANGYYELTDAQEQKSRFEAEQAVKISSGEEKRGFDQRFLDALDAGIPSCSGVALGLDRLLMILLQKNNIAEVMAFAFDRA